MFCSLISRAPRLALGVATVIRIFAAGSTGTESMQLQVDGVAVAEWDGVGGDGWAGNFNAFEAIVDGPVSPNAVRVAFTNDDGPRDLRVDRIEINGVAWETEGPGVWSTGTWTGAAIVPGYWQTEWLHANGWFQYSETDPARIAGKLGTARFDDQWTVIEDPVSFDDGVAMVGPATLNEVDPGSISCRLVDRLGFDLRFQEWPGEDGPHGLESADWMLLPRGRFVSSDGSVWETGVLEVGGAGRWTSRNFSEAFGAVPHVFLSIQTSNGNQPLTARVRNVTVSGFEAAVFSANEGGPPNPAERVGYLAILPAASSGVVAIGDTAVPYRVSTALVGTELVPVGGGVSLVLQEPRGSGAGSPPRAPELISVLSLGQRVFAQDQAFFDPGLFNLRAVKLPGEVVLPPGFRITPVVAGAEVNDAVALDVAADGRIFVAEESGRILVVPPGGGSPGLWMDLSRDVYRAFADEGGLSGFKLDPAFPVNGRVYALYTTGTPGNTFGRLASFRRQTGTGTGPSNWDQVILVGRSRSDGLIHDRFHNVGDIEFGFDGSLLFTWGDAAGNEETDPGQLRSQDLAVAAGKLFRVDPANGLGLRSNPFYRRSPSAPESRVFAQGLRNGFRIAVTPYGSRGTITGRAQNHKPGTIYIGEVGRFRFDEINIARGGENFGWPRMEGNVPYRTDPRIKRPRFAAPAVTLPHPETRSVILGDFYAGRSWPAEWRDTLFVTDFVEGWLRAYRPDARHSRLTELPFGKGLRGVTDMQYDPATDSMLFLGRGEDLIFNDETGLDGVFRLEYGGN